MDADRFDRLSRRIGQRADRRSMFRAALGGSLAVLGIGTSVRNAAAITGEHGAECFTNADCETGLTCEGASRGLLGGLVAEGPYGPPIAATLFGPSPGRCRYRQGCATSGQFCERNSDCCNGLNLVCRGRECQRR
jgi:hypothetical protein